MDWIWEIYVSANKQPILGTLRLHKKEKTNHTKKTLVSPGTFIGKHSKQGHYILLGILLNSF